LFSTKAKLKSMSTSPKEDRFGNSAEPNNTSSHTRTECPCALKSSTRCVRPLSLSST
jgi:hypothetical protein